MFVGWSFVRSPACRRGASFNDPRPAVAQLAAQRPCVRRGSRLTDCTHTRPAANNNNAAGTGHSPAAPCAPRRRRAGGGGRAREGSVGAGQRRARRRRRCDRCAAETGRVLSSHRRPAAVAVTTRARVGRLLSALSVLEATEPRSVRALPADRPDPTRRTGRAVRAAAAGAQRPGEQRPESVGATTLRRTWFRG